MAGEYRAFCRGLSLTTPPSAIGIVFLTLKLTGVISWSWWWVLAPFWAPPALLMTAALALYGVAWVLVTLENRGGR